MFRTTDFDATSGFGVFPEASQINHSCLPKVHHYWNSSIKRDTIPTVGDILVGEEILISSIELRRTFI